TTASTTTSQSARSLGSVVTRSREGSPPSILAQAATTFSSARQAEASLRARRIVSAVVVETAARPVAMAPLPPIPGLSYPFDPLMGGVPITLSRAVLCGLIDGSINRVRFPLTGPAWRPAKEERNGRNGERKRRARGARGRDRGGGPHAGRARPPREG